MPFVFYIFATLLIYLSYKSFRGGIDYLNYFKTELAKPRSEFTPFATIIAPCKGLDEGLAENLSALDEQDYPEYEVIFVVDDDADPAVPAIRQYLNRDTEMHRNENLAPQRFGGGDKVVIAYKTTESSQKVENLREAVLHADERSEVFVFVDSDARPAKDWLRDLVAPLEDESIGVATGYRWFISPKPTFASELRSAWNASIASALGPNMKSNFCWGGSMAIRRDVFERLDMRERWRGTLSDDFAVTRAMKKADLAIRFVPKALTPSIENCTFHECLEFTTRQMKITRVYASHLWLLSFFGSGLFTFLMLSAFLIVLLSGQNTMLAWAAIATLFLVSFFSIGKVWLRLSAVSLVIPDASKQTLAQLTLWLIAPPLFLYNCICALLSRKMVWRGIKYHLVSEKQTRRLT